jgi:lactoylglutathione lyase
MHSVFCHTEYNVFDLEKSIEFYKKAIGFTEKRRKTAGDGSFILVFLTDGSTDNELELTWLKDRTEPYDLGDNEAHIAVRVPDRDAAHALHEQMGCICYENHDMGLYFIEDPDGHWIEILK